MSGVPRSGTDERDERSAGPAPGRRSRAVLPGIGSVGLVALCVLFTLAVRVPFLTKPLMPDEAGLLIIAHNWAEGPYLYGDYFVGRGILLIAFYALADLLGGPLALRLLAGLVAAVMVVAAGWAGHLLRGRAGAGWAALVAAAWSSTYAFSSDVMNERLVAATLVMLCCALTLSAVQRPRPGGRAVMAGVLAIAPLLVVQSYADGLVFAGVVLLASLQARTISAGDAVRVAAGGLVGMLVAAAALGLVLATTWMTAAQWWFQMFGYRVAASRIVGVGTEKPLDRMQLLLWLATLSGMLLLVVCLLTGFREIRRRPDLRPTWFALWAMLGLTLASMAAGGDWWPDYLLQPIPALAMAAALVAPSITWSGLGARLAAVVATGAALVAVYLGLYNPLLGTPDNEAAVGEWMAAGAEDGDTVVVIWGQANVVYHSGMDSPYPYMWSLITRTLDPDLDRIVGTLRGPDAPTWVVQWYDFDAWGLDDEGRLADVMRERYVKVGTPCGMNVFVLRGADRDAPPSEACGHLG